MLRVQCEQCKAPYQVDERRVPANGLKMRCPKCAHTFLVKVDGVAPAAAGKDPSSSQLRVASDKRGPTSEAMRQMKSTMIGFGTGNAIVPARRPQNTLMAFGSSGALDETGGDLPAKLADLPVKAPPVVVGRPPPKIPPPTEGFEFDDPLDEGDLPAISAGSPGLPAKAPPAKPAPPPPAPRPAVTKSEVTKPELPATRPQVSAKFDLPAVPMKIDLPAVPKPKADLPATRPQVKPEPPAARPQPAPKMELPPVHPSASDLPVVRPRGMANDLPAVRTQSSDGLDLPLVRADLPAARVRVQTPTDTKTKELPHLAPRATMDDSSADLGSALPAVLGGNLPALGGNLPALQDDLPRLQELQDALPVVQNALPSLHEPLSLEEPSFDDFSSQPLELDDGPRPLAPPPASTREKIPVGPPIEPALSLDFDDTREEESVVPSSSRGGSDAFGEFGELELPSGPPSAGDPAPYVPPYVAPPAYAQDSEYSSTIVSPPPEINIKLDGDVAKPDTRFDTREAGGMAFGELDFGGDTETAGAPFESDELKLPSGPQGSGPMFPHGAHSLHPSTSARAPAMRPYDDLDAATEVRLPPGAAPPPPAAAPVGEANIPTEVKKARPALGAKKRSRAPRIAFGVVLLAAVVGGALELSPYGAFGRHTLFDVLHASDYQRLLIEASTSARARMSADVFSESESALDALNAAHKQTPRARPLAAYTAVAELGAQLRFGRDADREARARQTLSELPPKDDLFYPAAARAIEDALAGDLEKGRRGLEAIAPRMANDPLEEDLLHARGEIELAARNGAAAVESFTRAEAKSHSARAHHGLSRAYAVLKDYDSAKKEMEKVFLLSPNHVGARLMRASLAWDRDRNETAAVDDVTAILEGVSRPLASPREVAGAFALRGIIHAARGRAGEARSAFEKALQIEPREVRALIGQGEVFFHEGRFTEALTRFETAVQTDPANVDAIVSAAKAKIMLERLADAKTQLSAARSAYPKDPRVAYFSGRVAEALGDKPTAEREYQAAIDRVDPKDTDAVLPYVGLATLLAGQGRAKEADAKLAEARTKLPDSAVMQRALGEVAAVQGAFDVAVTHFQSAMEKDPLDLSTRFKLGVTLRRMRKLDAARAEFDKIFAADKDYPGLALERGLLYEDAGDVDKALEQFQGALAKAPDDPDLQMRVGAAYTAIGRSADAVPILKKVIEKRANSAEANHYLGRAIFLQGGAKEAEAMRYLKRAVELDPNHAEYHLYVAWAANESASPQLGLAREHVDKALAIDKLLADAYWQRGVLERKLGTVDDAIKDLKHALALKPSRVDAHAALAECYEIKNDIGNALTEWKTALSQDGKQAFWKYRYGRLLMDRGSAGEAAKHLGPAVTEAE